MGESTDLLYMLRMRVDHLRVKFESRDLREVVTRAQQWLDEVYAITRPGRYGSIGSVGWAMLRAAKSPGVVIRVNPRDCKKRPHVRFAARAITPEMDKTETRPVVLRFTYSAGEKRT